MPPRPSRNLDLALLAAGRSLLARRGCAGLSVREVAEAAGVNLGMFHYHFRSREAYLRALLQSMYEEMFAGLTFEVDTGKGAREDLRAALRFLGRFLRDNRPVLSRVLADALCGEPVAVDFLERNLPRHLDLVMGLIDRGQREGELAPLAVPQAMAICAGSLALPILFGGAVADSGRLSTARARRLRASLLSDAAIDERIDLALAALAGPRAAKAKPAARKRAAPARKASP